MKIRIRPFLFPSLAAVITVSIALAQKPAPKPSPAAPGPHGGVVVQDKSSQYEVKVGGGAVSVYTLKSEGPTPDSMTVTLFRDPESSETVEVTSVPPAPSGGEAPSYSGRLSPDITSFVGVEIKFGFPTEKKKRVLKSK